MTSAGISPLPLGGGGVFSKIHGDDNGCNVFVDLIGYPMIFMMAVMAMMFVLMTRISLMVLMTLDVRGIHGICGSHDSLDYSDSHDGLHGCDVRVDEWISLMPSYRCPWFSLCPPVFS
jgi:hypothetical protein